MRATRGSSVQQLPQRGNSPGAVAESTKQDWERAAATRQGLEEDKGKEDRDGMVEWCTLMLGTASSRK